MSTSYSSEFSPSEECVVCQPKGNCIAQTSARVQYSYWSLEYKSSE